MDGWINGLLINGLLIKNRNQQNCPRIYTKCTMKKLISMNAFLKST